MSPADVTPADLIEIARLRAGLWECGYRPVPVLSPDDPNPKKAGKAPIHRDWTKRARQTPPEAATTPALKHLANTGILCDGLRVVDVDIDNAGRADAVEELAIEFLGAAPTRRRDNSDRFALVYRAAEGEPGKRVLKGTTGDPEHPDKIEVLGKGQQFAAYGGHVSGGRLYWSGPDPLDLPLDRLPVVTEAQVTAFLAAVAPIIGAKAPAKRKPRAGTSGNGATAPALSRLAEALAMIPAEVADDYDSWIRIGAALHHETAGSDEGMAVWADWAATSGKFTADETETRWASFATRGNGRSVGAATIFYLATPYGWHPPDPADDPGYITALEADARQRGKPKFQPAPPADAPTVRPPTAGPVPPPKAAPSPQPQPGGGGGPPPPPDGEDGPEPDPDTGPDGEVPPDPDGRADGARLDEPAEVPAIYCIAGQLPRIVREAEAALLKAGKAVYQRGVLVRPAEVEYPAADGRQTHSAALVTITPPAMLKMLAEVAIWLKWDGRRKAWVTCNPPGDVVHILLASRGDWRFPVIRGVITCPALRPDGSLLTKPGYDEQSRYYLMLPTGLTLPDIPNRPSRAEALAALARLDGLLDGFSFVDDGGVSRAVALAILLTQVLRVAMTVSPLLTVSATTPGTGKSFLIDLAAAIASGRFCPVVPPGRNEEETEKGIRTKLVSSAPAFSIDNVYTMPNLPVLNQATERPLISIRLFGVLEEIEVENAVTIYMTGNNLAIIGEQNRRTLQCRMDAGVERPERRRFPLGNPIETVMADRGRYIADILIIARAYLTSNGPPPDLDPLGSYKEWSRLVREPLVWLGQPDPVLSQETTRENDPETIRLNAIITAWHVAFAMELRTLAQAAQFATTPPTYPGEYADADVLHAYNTHRAAQEQLLIALREAVPAARDGIDTSRWGYWMRRVAGVIAGGLRFIKDPGHTEGTIRWKLAKAPGAK